MTRRNDVIDLSDTNPTHHLPPPTAAALAQALSDASNRGYEPTAFGSRAARAEVAAYYERRSIAVNPDQVALVASTSEAYGHLFRLLANPGEEALVPSPSYPLLDHLAALSDVKLVPYPLAYDGSWYLPSDALEDKVTEKTRAIVVISPNNPTGSFLSAAERAQLTSFAASKGLAIISDEVFADFVTPPASHRDATFIGERDTLAFSLNGLSKSAGLPQIKAGWITISGPESEATEAKARLELVVDAHLSLSGPAEAVLRHVLPDVDPWQAALRQRLAANRARLDQVLSGSAARQRPSQGGWMSIIELPSLRSDEDWARFLLERCDVLVQPGYLFELSDRPCLVACLLGREDWFAEGARRLAEGIFEASS